MSTAMWVLAGIGVWLLVALALALVLGRVVRMRDRQVPDPPEGRAAEPPAAPPQPRYPPEPRSQRPPPGG